MPTCTICQCTDHLQVAVQRVLENANKVTAAQIKRFIEICRYRYLRAKIEPGTWILSSTTFLAYLLRINRRSCWRSVYR
jgi:hypothetical protein